MNATNQNMIGLTEKQIARIERIRAERADDRAASEKAHLLKNQKRRLDVVSRWTPFLLTLCRAGKGKQTRREWMGFIQHGARIVFETEEEEYQYIKKFGRGRWSEEFLKKGFTQNEIELIVDLAHEYGAFDY